MPDQAILNHAAQVLASITADQRADTALRFYFEHHRYLQPPAKRAISHTVFVYFRWLSWLEPTASSQKRLAQAVALHERFSADPKSIKPEALAALAVPAWVRAEMELPADYLRQLQRDPALWLRARPATGAKLAAALRDCEHSSHAPDALRYTGTQDLFRTEQFQTGGFEIQDLASQLVGHACAPTAGETWWDACAGEGGKTLHLADLMQNKGVVWATDRNAKRLDTLKRRAARAKLFNYRTDFWDGGSKLPTKQKFDGILLDAPCSGVGTWQRNPHARWTATPDDVRELAATQLALLSRVAGSLKPGGRLVYAVCTLTRSETTAVADAFGAAHPELESLPLLGAVAGGADPGPGLNEPGDHHALAAPAQRQRDVHRRVDAKKITAATVRADFNDPIAVVHYARAAHFLGLWDSERILIERFFPDKSAPLLEAGSGAGRATLGLWHQGYTNLTAFDFAEELVAQARFLATERGAGAIRFLVADATNLVGALAPKRPRAVGGNGPYRETEQFAGALFLFNGLMQIPGRENRRTALRELHRVCAPGAPLLFTTHDRDHSPVERALWRLETERWVRGEQDARLIEFGDRYFEDEAGRTFMHLPVRAEILEDLAATGWRHEFDAMRAEVARESKAVRDFSDECRLWVARKL